jgi:hypothetical protein
MSAPPPPRCERFDCPADDREARQIPQSTCPPRTTRVDVWPAPADTMQVPRRVPRRPSCAPARGGHEMPRRNAIGSSNIPSGRKALCASRTPSLLAVPDPIQADARNRVSLRTRQCNLLTRAMFCAPATQAVSAAAVGRPSPSDVTARMVVWRDPMRAAQALRDNRTRFHGAADERDGWVRDRIAERFYPVSVENIYS